MFSSITAGTSTGSSERTPYLMSAIFCIIRLPLGKWFEKSLILLDLFNGMERTSLNGYKVNIKYIMLNA